MTSNMMYLTVAAHQAELNRAANANQHRPSRSGGVSLRLPHALLQRLQTKAARPARSHVVVPRISI